MSRMRYKAATNTALPTPLYQPLVAVPSFSMVRGFRITLGIEAH
jgi:hypothetical protein